MPDSDLPGPMERCLLEQCPTCHWVLNPDGRFRFASGMTAAIFGKLPAELTSRHISEVLPEEMAGKWEALIARAVAGETMMLRERIGASLFCVACFPLRLPDTAAIHAGGYGLDITALGALEKELRDTTVRMLKAQESERGRLAKFLHDEVGQCLSAAGLQLDLLRMDFGEAEPEIGPRTAEVQGMLETVMAGVREFSYELNPDIVERAGLHAAMDRMVGRNRKLFSGNLRLLADTSLRFPPAVGSALHKIAAEAVENALQHAGCSQIEVIIKSTPDGPALEVRDNGKGFDAVDLGGPHRGLGLLVMEHYAEQARLRLSVNSELGKGTTVRAVFESGAAGEG